MRENKRNEKSLRVRDLFALRAEVRDEEKHDKSRRNSEKFLRERGKFIFNSSGEIRFLDQQGHAQSLVLVTLINFLNRDRIGKSN